MSVDPVEDIADGIVTFLNGAEDWVPPPSMSFQAIKDATPEERLYKEGLNSLLVVVMPFGESAEKVGRGGQALELYQVYLLVARAVNTAITRQSLSVFARELKLAIRRNRKISGYSWAGDATAVKYDIPQLRESGIFLNSVRLDFAAVR